VDSSKLQLKAFVNLEWLMDLVMTTDWLMDLVMTTDVVMLNLFSLQLHPFSDLHLKFCISALHNHYIVE